MYNGNLREVGYLHAPMIEEIANNFQGTRLNDQYQHDKLTKMYSRLTEIYEKFSTQANLPSLPQERQRMDGIFDEARQAGIANQAPNPDPQRRGNPAINLNIADITAPVEIQGRNPNGIR